MRERFCSLFKCYSLYCFGLLYKNRKKQIAVLQKNDLPIHIHFSPPNVCTQNTWFSVQYNRALCWDVRRLMIHFSCTIFFREISTSVWRTKYLLPQFSIFLVQEISLHFHFLKMSIRHLVVIFPVVVNRNRIRLELGFVPKYRSTTIFLARVFFCAIGGRALTITFIFNHHFFSLCQSPFFSC